MYFNSIVDVPTEPGKITIRKDIYVMYEIGRKYYADKKYNVPNRVTIGKLCENNREKMYPNEKFLTYFPDEDMSDYDIRSERSSCLRIGDFIVIKKMMEDTGIKSIIENVFENESGLFLDLVAYSIVTENNAAQYYPDYGYNHPLFSPEYRIYSDSKISTFLNSITNEQRLEVLNCWNDLKDHDNHIYVSYDSTNKNIHAGEIELAEFGHAKDDETKPIVNVGMGYDYKNREPLFYEEYPGSIVDVSQLKYMVDKAIGYGYKNIGFVLDRGYFSKGNLQYLDENQMPFVIMAKGNAKFINGFVKDVQGTFEDDRKKRISKYKVYGTTARTKLFPTDNKNRYIHVYYNDLRAAVERENFEAKIEKMDRNLKKLIGTDKVVKEAEKYFRFERDKEGIIAAIAPKNAEITKAKKMYGYFVIVTSKRMTAENALYLYKSRDASEKLFRADKSYLGNHTMRVQTDEALKAKLLIGFVALIVRNKIYTCLDNAIEDGENKPNYMTVPAALRELEKIEMIRQTDGIYRLDHAVTATQRHILKTFGIEAKSVPSKALFIADELAKIDGIRF